MDYKVIVMPDENGNVVSISPNNPEYGWVRVCQEKDTHAEDGWENTVKVWAIIKNKTENLLRKKYQPFQELPGKIVTQESLDPFNKNDMERHIKRAGACGVICRVDDQPIFRRTFYTTNMKLEDTLIEHTNSDEIKEAIQEMKAALKHVRGPIYEVASF